jgi:hypothetical protein
MQRSETPQTTRTRIPIPAGGLCTNEDEARWLEQTILLRTSETLASAGVTCQIAPKGLYDLLLLSLNEASKRGRKEAAPMA